MKNDFVISVKDDLKVFGLPTENFEDLKNYSIREFKKLVTKNMYKVAFDFLIGEKTKLKKGRLLSYNKLEMQPYLRSGSKLSNHEAKQIFNLQTENLDIPSNFSKKYKNETKCVPNICNEEICQNHLYDKCNLQSSQVYLIDSNDGKYEDIFSGSITKQVNVMRRIMLAFKARNDYLSYPPRGDPVAP